MTRKTGKDGRIEELNRRLRETGVVSAKGSAGAFSAWVLSGLEAPRILAVTETDLEARKLARDLSVLSPKPVLFLPTREISFHRTYAHSRETESERIRVLVRILEGKPLIVATAVNNLMTPYLPPAGFKGHMKRLAWGERHPLGHLLAFLERAGYESVEAVQAKGQFSRRGGILDVFPPHGEQPFRIEFFDDEVDSIRFFDVETQLSVEKVESVWIAPAREAVFDSSERRRILKALEAEKAPGPSKEVPEERERLLEALSQSSGAHDWFNFLPYAEHGDLRAYFDEGTVLVCLNENRLRQRSEAYRRDFLESYRMHLEKGDAWAGQHALVKPYGHEAFPLPLVRFGGFDDNRPKDKVLSFSVRPQEGFKGRVDALTSHLEEARAKGCKSLLFTGGREKAARLKAELLNRGIEAFFRVPGKEVPPGTVALSEESLSGGFRYEEGGWNVLCERELYGVERRHRRTPPSGRKRPIKRFTDLKPGDIVVHENHGIARFKGIRQLEVEKVRKDYLQLEYRKGDFLYVPVNQMDLVQKYLGSEGAGPKLSLLGGSEWQKAKGRARKSIEDLTEDLLALYARRTAARGHAFMEDTNWQGEFEERFEYDETPDQLRAVEEIKRDMEKDRPMDRLLCGDVGYGKTEVALRAAFKAINDGKQVAFLVPTTILAQQHYNTVRRRMGPFPVGIEMLSRFRSGERQKKILEEIRRGGIDLVVGTHRLLSKDVRFKDLGLLIIDEEQRFGVKHKERLKELKASIDVLSLSATPIPRTLHMSLVGIRDISVIEDPPEERHPVETFVMEKSDELIREAVTRELDREGQVYYVHNRIKDISREAARVAKLVPGARVAYAHGQMPERMLEDIMIDFLDGSIDVLVCTTIIETGLDIPNVNTILINRADHMGLSQLYQLRGRVGRSSRVARAYLLYDRGKVVTPLAEERLKAIKAFTELGSGFKIAMRDLEIRGTGNLLGSQQHGQMEAVGYDLYVKMMESAVRKIKGEPAEEPVETSIEIRISAHIPEAYIENEMLRLETYKRIASIETKEDYHAMGEEMEDRFGTPPEAVYNLLDVAYLKALAGRFGIGEIRENDAFYRFDLAPGQRMVPALAARILESRKDRIHLHAGEPVRLLYRFKGREVDEKARLTEAIGFMEEINSFKASAIHI